MVQNEKYIQEKSLSVSQRQFLLIRSNSELYNNYSTKSSYTYIQIIMSIVMSPAKQWRRSREELSNTIIPMLYTRQQRSSQQTQLTQYYQCEITDQPTWNSTTVVSQTKLCRAASLWCHRPLSSGTQPLQISQIQKKGTNIIMVSQTRDSQSIMICWLNCRGVA